MNKKGFIKKLSEVLNYSEKDCEIINSVLEDNFLIGRKNKKNIINCFVDKLNIDNTEAEMIYNISIDLIGKEIKNKIVHPFKNKED